MIQQNEKRNSSPRGYDSTATVDDGSCLYPLLPNDSCKSAMAINCGDTINGSTLGATNGDAPDSVCGTTLNTAPGVWYSFFGDGTTWTASLCGSSYDTKIASFVGECGSAINCVGGNDDFCGLQSEVSFNTTSGVLQYLYVTGFSTNSGDFTLVLSCGDVLGCTDSTALNYDPTATVDDGSCVAPPPVNDFCADRLAVACGDTVSGTSTAATSTGEPVSVCGTAPQAPGVWYSFLGTGDAVTISTCGSAYDTRLNVYTGPACDSASLEASCVGGNDDFCGTRSSFTWPSVSGIGSEPCNIDVIQLTRYRTKTCC